MRHMNEWNRRGRFGIRQRDRDEAYNTLHQLELQTPARTTVQKGEPARTFIKAYAPVLVIARPGEQSTAGAFDIRTERDYQRFVRAQGGEGKSFELIEQIEGVRDGFVGAAMYDGTETLIELLARPYISNICELSSGGANPRQLHSARYIGRLKVGGDDSAFRRDMATLRDSVSVIPGYYEFIRGMGRDGERIWFTDFQDDQRYWTLPPQQNRR